MELKPCDRYLMAIDELVDGTIGPIRRAELEMHVEGCDGCKAWLTDLRRIVEAARSMPPIPPPAQAWTGIADRLRAEGRVSAGPRRGRAINTTILALAAALILGVGASLFVLFPRTPEGDAAPAPSQAAVPGNPAASDPVQSLDSELALTERHFQNAVEATRSQTAVDAETAAVLQKNMLVINQAIAESRAALKTDPDSLRARDSLYGSLKQKIQFLQNTIALMNQMRRGDADATARIVEGGKS